MMSQEQNLKSFIVQKSHFGRAYESFQVLLSSKLCFTSRCPVRQSPFRKSNTRDVRGARPHLHCLCGTIVIPLLPEFQKAHDPPKSPSTLIEAVPHTDTPPPNSANAINGCRSNNKSKTYRDLFSLFQILQRLRHKKYNSCPLLQMFKRRQERGHMIYCKILMLLSKRSFPSPVAQQQSFLSEKKCNIAKATYNINFFSLG